jgi:hypothetical protein
MALRGLSRREWLALAAIAPIRAQEPIQWVCPMDPDIRSPQPARCRKCGMQLVAGLPEPEEYPVRMTVSPAAPAPGTELMLKFQVAHPHGHQHVSLQLIHEKLFHLFLVSKDLSVFRHDHPQPQGDGSFVLRTTLPKGGMYRVLCDFYPEGGTPQMIAKTLFLSGASPSARIQEDLATQTAENVKVSLRLDPERPLAGKKTMLFFSLDPPDGLERYLGAWGHLLTASADLIDLIHTHPAWEENGPSVQFNLIFPRPGIHRVWVQFQRLGVVNTAAFNVLVGAI